MLEKTGYPVAYRAFKTQPTLPFISILAQGSDNFSADNHVYAATQDYHIELYTDIKDLETEESLEVLLNANSIYWGKLENYIDAEQMFQIVYTINI